MSQLVRHPEKPGRSGRVLVGATAIYIGVECHDDDPDGIVSYSKARDSNLDREDHMRLVRDTFATDGRVTSSPRTAQLIGPGVLPSLTLNTDFAETEVDARVVNLTRFPLFFPERRSFFLKGADIFEFGLGLGNDLIPFFSRRIGIQIFNPKLDYLVRPDWSWLRNMVFEFNVIPEGDRPTEPFVIADDVVIRPGSYEWTRYRVEADFAPERPVSATTARYREAHSTRKWPARGWRWTFHPQGELFVVHNYGVADFTAQSETETNLLQVKVRYTFRK